MSGLDVNGSGFEPSPPMATLPPLTSRPKGLLIRLNKGQEGTANKMCSRYPKVIRKSSRVKEGIRQADDF